MPRTLIGGYKPGPTNALLRRVAWDYRQVVYESKTLATAVDEFTRRIAELETQLAQLDGTPESGPDAQNLPESVLEEAQRAAAELRASTRTECEAMLERARAKSRQIEATAGVRSGGKASEIVQLEGLLQRIRDELREMLESVSSLDSSTPFEARVGGEHQGERPQRQQGFRG